MKKTVLIGLGGTGGRVVQCTAEEIVKRNGSFPDDCICCAVLDMDPHDRQLFIEPSRNIYHCCIGEPGRVRDCVERLRGVKDLSWLPVLSLPVQHSDMLSSGMMRWKGRLAFMNAMENGHLRGLEKMLFHGLGRDENDGVRIVIAGSLAGGTGAGIFIQVALWLRRLFAQRNIPVSLEGQFLLPDIFADCYEMEHTNPRRKLQMYANTYASVLEWSAIDGFKTKGEKTLQTIRLDGLFDSEHDEPDGMPVFDQAFLTGSVLADDRRLRDVGDYENALGRILGARALDPYFAETEWHKIYLRPRDTLYFSACGTAKAEYPMEEVLRYCALRAAQDTSREGWSGAYAGLTGYNDPEEAREKTEIQDPRVLFVRKFDEYIKKMGAANGCDDLVRDILEEQRFCKADGSIKVLRLDKVDAYLERVDKEIEAAVDDNGRLALKELNVAKELNNVDDPERMILLVKRAEERVKRFVNAAEEVAEVCACRIMERILPEAPEAVNKKDPVSFAWLFERQNYEESAEAIHPLAVKYLLCRLMTALREHRQEVMLDDLRFKALSGAQHGFWQAEFDNPATRELEMDPEAYLRSKRFFQGTERFLERFKVRYSVFLREWIERSRHYAVECVKRRLEELLCPRIEGYLEAVESIIDTVQILNQSLQSMIDENIQKDMDSVATVLRVCGTAKEKEWIYRALSFNVMRNDGNINRIFLNRVCELEKERRQALMALGENRERSSDYNLVAHMITAYENRILRENGAQIDMDLYTAIGVSVECAASDPAVNSLTARSQAVQTVVDRLYELSAPMLKYDRDDENIMGINFATTVEKVIMEVPAGETYMDRVPGWQGYGREYKTHNSPKNQWNCYRNIFGIKADQIRLFSKAAENGYSRYYSVRMEHIRRSGEHEMTPHLDGTWDAGLSVTPAE